MAALTFSGIVYVILFIKVVTTFRVAVYRSSLVDGVFSWAILKNCHSEFSFGFISEPFAGDIIDFINFS